MQKHDLSQNDDPIYDVNNPITFVNQIMDILQSPPDLVNQTITLSPDLHIICVFIKTLVDKNIINHDLLNSLSELPLDSEMHTSESIMNTLQSRIPLSSRLTTTDLNSCVQSLLNGKCLFLISNTSQMLLLDASKSAHRNVSEPLTESTVRGPQEGFSEDIAINYSLLRKRIKNVHFRIEQIVIGTETETIVSILYLENLAPVAVVDEFRKRISSIRIDSILDSAYVEELIQDKTLSPFSTLLNTERPDIVASHLLEGRVSVLVDGSPIALVGPITFFNFLFLRKIIIKELILPLSFDGRVLAFMLAIIVPSLYVAVISYHPELLPHTLLISISSQREGVPFPAIIEAAIMMITFELLREAGLRMPRIAGQSISIVGALVLGQAV